MSSILGIALFVSAIGATLLSLALIMIMWHMSYGESSVRIATTGALAVIAMPSWFIVLLGIWRGLFG